MSREDILLDLYKIHAYIQNDAVDNPLTPFGNFCKGYEACESEQAKRIAKLQAQNAELVEALKDILFQGECQLNEDKEQLFVEVGKKEIRAAINY